MQRLIHGLQGCTGRGIDIGGKVRQGLIGGGDGSVQLRLYLLRRSDQIVGLRRRDGFDRVLRVDDGLCGRADDVCRLLWDRAPWR